MKKLFLLLLLFLLVGSLVTVNVSAQQEETGFAKLVYALWGKIKPFVTGASIAEQPFQPQIIIEEEPIIESSVLEMPSIQEDVPDVQIQATTNVSACGASLSVDTYYVLNKSVNSTGTCFTISANNVTLDCAGYRINGTDTVRGVDNSGGYDNVTVKNCIVTHFTVGILFGNGANNGNITNNIISNNTDAGIQLDSNSNNNSIVGNTVEDNINQGIILSLGSSNNIFIDNTINNNGVNIFLLVNANNNTFTNNVLSIPQIQYLTTSYLTVDSSSRNNITNTTFSSANGSVRFPGTLAMPTSIDVLLTRLNITSNNVYLNSTSLSSLNTSAEITLHGLSFTEPQIIVDYEDDGSFVVCSAPECNNLSYNGSTFVFNVSSFTSYSIQETPSECKTLNTANAVETLINDVNSSGTCFTIGANNITLDCNGYMINYSYSSVGFGVDTINYNSIEVKDCLIVQENSSVGGANAISIYGLNNRIINNTINVMGNYSYGVLLNGNHSIVSGNNITTMGPDSNGIYSDNNINITISNNDIDVTGSSAAGIFLNSALNSTISNNLISSGPNTAGVSLSDSNNIGITNNNISMNSSTTNGISVTSSNGSVLSGNIINLTGPSSGGISVSSDYNTQILNNIFEIVNGTGIVTMNTININILSNNLSIKGAVPQGINLDSTNNSNVGNNRIITNTTDGNFGVGVILRIGSINNTVFGNDITTININGPDSFGIQIDSNSLNNKIVNNTINSSGQYGDGIRVLEGSNNNFLLNNNISSDGTNVMGIRISSVNYTIVRSNTIIVTGVGSENGIGINSNSDNSILEDNIITTVASNAHGIQLSSSSNGIIGYNTIFTSGDGGRGVRISSSSDNNTIQGNYVTTVGNTNARGIHLSNSDDALIENNVILTTGDSRSRGIQLDSGSVNNTLLSNNITTTGDNRGNGIASFNSGTSFNEILNNIIITTGEPGSGSPAHGIILGDDGGFSNVSNNVITTSGANARGVDLRSSNNNVQNNTINTTNSGADGMYFDSSSNNIVYENAIITSGRGAMGFQIRSGSKNNTFDSNSIATSGDNARGIRSRSGTSKNTYTNNIIITSGTVASGFRFETSTNNTIIDNNITTTGLFSRGIRLQVDSNDNNITNNNINASNDQGIQLRARSNRNFIIGNFLSTSQVASIDIESSSDNVFINNILFAQSLYLNSHPFFLQNGGFSVDPSDGTIYAVENSFGTSEFGFGSSAVFFKINQTTGEAFDLIRLTLASSDPTFGFGALEITSDGRFFALRGAGSNELYEINTTDGNLTLISLTLPGLSGSLNGLESISGDSNSLLATTNGGDLVRINITSLTASVIGNSGTGWSGISTNSSGDIFVFSRRNSESTGTNHLYRVSVTDGSIIVEIGDTGFSFMSDIDFYNDTLFADFENGFGIVSTVDASVTTVGGGFGFDPYELNSTGNNMTNTTFLANNGSVRYPQTIDIPNLVEVNTGNLNVSFNKIFLDNSEINFLNTSAEITLEGINFINPRPIVDFDDDGFYDVCNTPQCEEVSYNLLGNNNFVFNVSSFTSYSSQETPRITPAVESLPSETEELGYGCPPTYECGEWSECSIDDARVRICEDVLCTFPDRVEIEECLYLFPAPEFEKPVFDLIIKNTYLDKTITKLREEPFFIFVAWFVILGLVSMLWPVVSKGLKKGWMLKSS